MDFTKRVTFAGIEFKPTKTGAVRWMTVKKILKRGGVECLWYTYGNHSDSGTKIGTVQSVLEMGGQDRCYIGVGNVHHENPRYKGQRFIRVSFRSSSFVTLYDLAELPELADGTEVEEVEEVEACVGCDVTPDEPEALVVRGCLRLIVSN